MYVRRVWLGTRTREAVRSHGRHGSPGGIRVGPERGGPSDGIDVGGDGIVRKSVRKPIDQTAVVRAD